jgi:hypothetical protein
MPKFDPIILSEQLIALIKETKDPNAIKLALVLQDLALGGLGIPEPTRDDHNNPIWKLPMEAKVHRQDNSLSLSQHAGKLENDHVLANVSNIFGGFVFGLDVQLKRRGKLHGPTIRYALDCRPLLERIVELDPVLRKVPQLPRKEQRKNVVHSRSPSPRSPSGSSRKDGTASKRK